MFKIGEIRKKVDAEREADAKGAATSAMSVISEQAKAQGEPDPFAKPPKVGSGCLGLGLPKGK